MRTLRSSPAATGYHSSSTGGRDGIDNLYDLSGLDVNRYQVQRRTEDDLATATMKSQLATLQLFLRFCVSIDAVKAGFGVRIILLTTAKKDDRNEKGRERVDGGRGDVEGGMFISVPGN